MTSEPDASNLRLRRWLETNVSDFTGPFELAKFGSGQSNPTYRLSAASGDYVLRRKPFGVLVPSAHAVDREFRLLSALHPIDVPVPRPLAYCDDPEIIGVNFYVMEMADGISHADGALPGLSADQRREIYTQLVNALANLHNVDVGQAGLADFGSPGNYFERQIGRWLRQYRQTQTDELPDMERLLAYLPTSIPPQAGVSIVHGDYRIDNVLFTAQGKLSAILDWELATTGDPLADFSYFALQWVLPHDGGAGLLGLDLAHLGIPTLDEIIDLYAGISRVTFQATLDWYFAYNLFRLAAIVQGIKKRYLDGSASQSQAAEIAKRVPSLARTAWNFAQRAGA